MGVVDNMTAESLAAGGVPPDPSPAESAVTAPRAPETGGSATKEVGHQSVTPAQPATPGETNDPEGNLGKLGRRVWRPSTFMSLAVLGALAALSIIGGLVFGDSPLGKTCVIGLVPAFSIAIGVVVTHWYSQRGLNEQLASAVQNATYTTLHLKRSVQYVDDRLELAKGHLENGDGFEALIEVVQARTATHLSFATAQQSSRQWESISEKGARAAQALFVEDDDEMRPLIRLGDNPKTVATSEEVATGGGGGHE